VLCNVRYSSNSKVSYRKSSKQEGKLTLLHLPRFKQIFAFMDSLNLEVSENDRKELPLLKDHFLLAVHAPDATVVYYNIARGLVKPIN
jgi:Sen15 protein